MSLRARKAHAKFCENVERFRELLRLWKDSECFLLETALGRGESCCLPSSRPSACPRLGETQSPGWLLITALLLSLIPAPGLPSPPIPSQAFCPRRTLTCPLSSVFSQAPLTMIMSGPSPILIRMLCSSASTSADQRHWTVSSRRWAPGKQDVRRRGTRNRGSDTAGAIDLRVCEALLLPTPLP